MVRGPSAGHGSGRKGQPRAVHAGPTHHQPPAPPAAPPGPAAAAQSRRPPAPRATAADGGRGAVSRLLKCRGTSRHSQPRRQPFPSTRPWTRLPLPPVPLQPAVPAPAQQTDGCTAAPGAWQSQPPPRACCVQARAAPPPAGVAGSGRAGRRQCRGRSGSGSAPQRAVQGGRGGKADHGASTHQKGAACSSQSGKANTVRPTTEGLHPTRCTAHPIYCCPTPAGAARPPGCRPAGPGGATALGLAPTQRCCTLARCRQ